MNSSDSPLKEEPVDMEQQMQLMKKREDNYLWMVIKCLKAGNEKMAYKIKKGDIIKLGRIKFRVKFIKTPDYSMEEVVE